MALPARNCHRPTYRPKIPFVLPTCARELRRSFNVFYDEAGNIGRRYRRQDEVGTPFCITYDFESETDHRVTVRERDSMTQERIPVEGLRAHLLERLENAR